MRESGLATRTNVRIVPNPGRVITRLFIPGEELVGWSGSRALSVVDRFARVDEDQVVSMLGELRERFAGRHPDIEAVFAAHAEHVRGYLEGPVSDARRLVLGALFTHEYAIEAASVCNPSIVAHPDQTGLNEGELRFVMSYRAIGEGHRSSLAFHTGVLGASGKFDLDVATDNPVVGTVRPALLRREHLHALLRDRDLDGGVLSTLLNSMGERFSRIELEHAIVQFTSNLDTRTSPHEAAGLLQHLAQRCYDVEFSAGVDLNQRVLWPASSAERHGIEDARFVERRDEGYARYCATYTAFDGSAVSQQLLETDDFRTFHSTPLAGKGSSNKGLALFPRRINGQFVSLSRFDRESNSISYSSDPYRWDELQLLHNPTQSWEIVQLGNCGSPLELDEGWLVLVHGVGPMRTYVISAILLALDDPSRMLAQLDVPLLVPQESERDGYVPNVVYSCGSLAHRGTIYLPFGIADQSIGVATIQIDELVAALSRSRVG